jgi:hypothetical protein
VKIFNLKSGPKIFIATAALLVPWIFVLNCFFYILNTGQMNSQSFFTTLISSTITGVLFALIFPPVYRGKRE